MARKNCELEKRSTFGKKREVYDWEEMEGGRKKQYDQK